MLRLVAYSTALAAFLAIPAASVSAQIPAAPVVAPDPARLVAAQALIEQIMPAAQREQMVEGIVRPMIENVRAAMLSSPIFEKARTENPKIGAIIDEYLTDELDRSMAETRQAMPMIFDAMSRAYARRFTLAELKAIAMFFDTPAGRSYARESLTIMSDPDIQAAQRAMMTKTMSDMQGRIATLAAKLSAEEGQATTCSKRAHCNSH